MQVNKHPFTVLLVFCITNDHHGVEGGDGGGEGLLGDVQVEGELNDPQVLEDSSARAVGRLHPGVPTQALPLKSVTKCCPSSPLFGKYSVVFCMGTFPF